MEFTVELFIHYSCQSMSNPAVPIAFVLQGLWMNSSTLITMAIGPVSALRNYPLLSYYTDIVDTLKSLKTHIRDKWVCVMETSQCIADPRTILLRYIAECELGGSSGQVHKSKNLNGCLGPCLGPQAVFAFMFSLLYLHSAKWHMERNWGSHHWNA